MEFMGRRTDMKTLIIVMAVCFIATVIVSEIATWEDPV
jgi:Na+-transporting NADH:ubiquinone oxidoreductase subunit NqrC